MAHPNRGSVGNFSRHLREQEPQQQQNRRHAQVRVVAGQQGQQQPLRRAANDTLMDQLGQLNAPPATPRGQQLVAGANPPPPSAPTRGPAPNAGQQQQQRAHGGGDGGPDPLAAGPLARQQPTARSSVASFVALCSRCGDKAELKNYRVTYQLNKRLEDERDQARQELEEARQENADLRVALAATDDPNLGMMMAHLQRENNTLRDENNTLRAQVAQLQAQVAQLQLENNTLREQVAQLQHE